MGGSFSGLRTGSQTALWRPGFLHQVAGLEALKVYEECGAGEVVGSYDFGSSGTEGG